MRRVAAAAFLATLGLGLGACATVPVAETPLLAGRATGPREARVLEALGQFDAAWAAGLPGGATRAGDRWAATRLLGIIDRVGASALTAAVFERVLAAGPPWSELAVAIAVRLGEPDALARAERACGTVFHVRRSGRLAAWPGAVPWGARVGTGASYGEPMAYHAGQLASPEEGPGLYGFLVAPPSSEAATYEVELRAEGAFKAYVGGREVAANLRHRMLAPERVRFTVELGPGAPLELLVWDRANVARAELALVPTSGVATVASGSTGASRAAGPDASADPLAALELAIADGDGGALDAAAARLGSDPLSALGRAEALLADATRPPTMAREAARQALETLVALHPELTEARERLGELLLADGELADARRVLSGLAESEAVLTLAEQSGDTLAVQRLARAWSEYAPRSCLAAGWLTGDDAGLAHPAQALAATRGTCFEAAMRAGERLLAARALDVAERVARRLVAALDPGPERARAAILTATIALARGDHAAAATASEAALSDGGVRAAALELLTRARRLAGLPVVAARDAGWELLRRSLDPARDLGLPLADARPVIMAVLGKPVPGEAAETIRDDRFVRILPDGGQIIRTHTIMRLSSPQAVAQLGELTVPDGAELLLARTWKAPAKTAGAPGKPSGQNGKPPGTAAGAALRPLEPEDIGDKATISFPAVAGGDFVEWAYFRYVPPDPRVAPGWAFQHAFDAETGPVHTARLTLSLAPGATPPSFVADPRVPAPTRPDSTTWLWIADGLPRYVPEALDPRPDLRAVTLHAWAAVSPVAWGEAARAELTPLALVTPAVRAFVVEALRGTAAETDAARLAALQRHLDKAITPEDVPLSASNASYVALRGRGERALLFWSACRALGLGCELVLARPLSEGPMPPLPPAPGGWPDPEGFSYPLVRATADRSALWFDPGARFQPFATLLPNLEGVDALALGDDGVEMLRTPSNSGGGNGAQPHPDNGSRQTTIDLVVAADGKTFTASGSERLTGLYGAAWRANLVALSPVEREQALIHIVQARLPDVVAPVITLDGLTDPEAALVWRFTAHGAAPTARKRARLLVGLAPEGIARATIVVAERKTPLLVNRSVDSETTLIVTIPATFQFAPPPADVHVAHPSLAFERTARLAASAAGTRALTIQKRLHVRPAIIAPEDYPAWIRAAIPADRGEIVELGWGLGLDP